MPKNILVPSPFPGMDPFIEAQGWESLHAQFIAALQESLAPRIGPRYVVVVEVRVYLEHPSSSEQPYVRPDVTVINRGTDDPPRPSLPVSAATPIVMTVPVPEEIRETFLTVRETSTRDVIAVVEILSPANKRRGDGRREYLAKRDATLRTATHLIELDLLRGGLRLPTVEPLPEADYYAYVCQSCAAPCARGGDRRPRAEVYAWTLRHPLPAIPIPLAAGDDDVVVDLQALLEAVYERAGYTWSLDYSLPVAPPAREDDLSWIREQVSRRRGQAPPLL